MMLLIVDTFFVETLCCDVIDVETLGCDIIDVETCYGVTDC